MVRNSEILTSPEMGDRARCRTIEVDISWRLPLDAVSMKTIISTLHRRRARSLFLRRRLAQDVPAAQPAVRRSARPRSPMRRRKSCFRRIRAKSVSDHGMTTREQLVAPARRLKCLADRALRTSRQISAVDPSFHAAHAHGVGRSTTAHRAGRRLRQARKMDFLPLRATAIGARRVPAGRIPIDRLQSSRPRPDPGDCDRQARPDASRLARSRAVDGRGRRWSRASAAKIEAAASSDSLRHLLEADARLTMADSRLRPSVATN